MTNVSGFSIASKTKNKTYEYSTVPSSSLLLNLNLLVFIIFQIYNLHCDVQSGQRRLDCASYRGPLKIHSRFHLSI